jgi:hypothetical protein
LDAAPDDEHKVSKDKCKYAVYSEEANTAVIFAFDRNWYRGTGMIVDGDCVYPMRFIRE